MNNIRALTLYAIVLPLLTAAIATRAYAVPDGIPMPVLGARVAVPFSGRRLVGLVVALNPPDAHPRVRPLSAVLDEENVLGEEIFQLDRWLSNYYQHPLGEVLATLLPGGARRPEALRIRRPEVWELAVSDANLDRAPRQKALFELLRSSGGALTAGQIREAGYERGVGRPDRDSAGA